MWHRRSTTTQKETFRERLGLSNHASLEQSSWRAATRLRYPAASPPTGAARREGCKPRESAPPRRAPS
ncbi:hypothetical protein NDU88_001632 [Pleurodeles waltl]|uniref:Uncharacterized protein n=1 Tax=Pleurodeles waltl TaxID=8319 RepID=A0AAV7MKB4_PLEWA|nr:hypothetical protein NDU88_001632 [Pleurodeles waltl]